jgi:peptidyl-prolyl cis-trans isomerase C
LLAGLAIGAGGVYAVNTSSNPSTKAITGTGTVIASVDNIKVYSSQLEERLRRLPVELFADKAKLAEVQKALMDQLVAEAVLDATIQKENIATDKVLQERLSLANLQVARDFLVNKRLEGAVSDEKLKAAYENLVVKADPNQDLKIRHIAVDTKEKAAAIIAALDAGGAFDELMEQNKGVVPAGKQTKAENDEALRVFAVAAKDLKAGEYTRTPVQSPFGWHVIRLDDRKATPKPTFEQALPGLRQQVAQDEVRKLVDTLKASTKINVDMAAVETAVNAVASTAAAPK